MTAYYMRIGDWSSDLCSSYLHQRLGDRFARFRQMVRRAYRRDIAAVDVVGIEQAQLIFDAQDAAHRVVEPRGADRPGLRLAQRALVEPLPPARRHTHVKART